MSIPEPLAVMDAVLAFAALAAAKVTLLVGLVAIAALALSRQSAALRHFLWSLALGGAVALPIVMAAMPLRLPLLPAPVLPAVADAGSDARALAASNGTAPTPMELESVEGPGASGSETGSAMPDWRALALVGWLAGVLLLLARFIRGLRMVRGIVARAVPVTDGAWQALLGRARDPGMPAPALRISDEVDMPFASGVSGATIVLPASSRLWTAERREAVLLHEIAHLSRGDLFMNALSHVARALYWFNPLVWYAAHRLRVEAERACDDAVLRRGAAASAYAGHLLSIATGATSRVPAAALAMARPSAFEGRLLAILEPGLERAAPSRARLGLTTAAFLLLILPLAAASPTARAVAMPAQDPAAEPAPRRDATAASAVPALIEALSDASPAVRLAAVGSLGSLEDPRAIAALGKALREDTDPRVRKAAAESLGEIDDPRAVPHLLAALRTEQVTDVRVQIVEALREIDDASAVAGVEAVTKDASPAVRRAAISALAEFEVQSSVAAIVSLAKDEDVQVRREVADALGDLESASALDALIGLARDSDAEVRANAVDALGNLEDRRAMSALVGALRDPSADVRRNAADAIHNIPDLERAPQQLIDALADTDKDVRHNVAHALGSIGDEAAVPGLKRSLTDTNADVRRAVAEALADIGGADAITALMGLLKDPDPEIRRIAAEALGKRR